MKLQRGWLVTLLLTVLFLGGALSFQRRMIEKFYQEPEKYRDSLYVPSRGYLEVIALGYKQVFSDFFWLRMIQAFAAGWSRPENAEQMYSYFEGITDLDPRFLEVYSFAMMAVGEEGHRDDMVRNLLRKSFLKAPGNWKIPSEGAAYFALTNQKDVRLAKYYTGLALLSPDHPEYLENWIGYFDVKEGRYRPAYDRYMTDYVRSLMHGKDQFTPIRRVHLVRAIDEWFKEEIRKRAQEWLDRTGQMPTIQQLEDAGAFRGVVLPDWRGIRGFLDQLEQSASLQTAGQQETRDVIQRFIKTWDRLPSEAPYDAFAPAYPGYAFWPTPKKQAPFEVIPKLDVLRRYKYVTAIYDARIGNYMKQHHGRCPDDVSALVPEALVPGRKDFRDPLGGEFKIDPATCQLTITSVPEIRHLAIPEL
jgi:hypothetical protein